MGPIRCPETSVINYHYSLRNNPEEHTSQHRKKHRFHMDRRFGGRHKWTKRASEREILKGPGGKGTYGMHVVACYFPAVPKLKLKITVSRCGGCKEVCAWKMAGEKIGLHLCFPKVSVDTLL